nr:TlpA disulfide reductase family protein [uncultured Carboxylicivirga sp.]
MKKLPPLILTISFVTILILNTQLTNWNNSRIFRTYKSIDEPIRAVLANNDFLADEKDTEILVINLWATWCQPCQKEISQLNKLMEKYEQDNVLFLAVTAEQQQDVNDWMELQKYPFLYYQLFDQHDLMNYLFELNPDLSFKKGQKPQGLPTNIIIKNKELMYFHTGYSEETIEAIEKTLKKIL